jgi:transposase-like protein
MATVLEEYNTEEQRLVVRFLWAKGFSANDIHKEIFPIYGGKCFSHKAVHNWVEKRGKRFADEETETKEQKWQRQQSKDFYAAGLDALVK